MLFFILAMKSARGAGVSFGHVRARDWGVLRRPLVWSALAGLALGLYLLTWSGGALFLLIIFAFAVVQYIMDHLRRRSTDYLCIVAIPTLAISLIVIAPSANGYSLWNVQAASLLVCALAFLTLSASSVLMVRRNLSPAYYAVAIASLGAIGLGLFYAVAPDLLETMLDKLDVLRPTGGKLTVSEAQGMSISDTWEFFTTGFWLSMASLALLAYIILKEGAADKTLFFVWTVIMLIAAFGQQRFAYYLAINVALLTAYLSWRILELVGFADSKAEPVVEVQSNSVVMPAERDRHKLSKKARRRREAQRKQQAAPRESFFRGSHAVGLLALIVIFFLAFFPNIGKAVDWAEPRYGPSDDWHEALSWMQENTPDPFGDPDFYFERHEKPPRNRFDYPESAYGVMAWWDPGNWITYMAHRIPNASSRGQRGATDAAEFLLAQDEASANQVLDRLGSRYVIIEAENIVPRSRFGIGEMGAFITWAGQSPSSTIKPKTANLPRSWPTIPHTTGP